jgi:hypothetical protein
VPLIGIAVPACAAAGVASGVAGQPMVRIGKLAKLPAGASVTGNVAGATDLDIDIALTPRDPGGLAQAAAAVSSPKSSYYRRYISPAVFGEYFSPTSAEVAATSAALRAEGLSTEAPSDYGLVIPVKATAAQIDSAFQTRLETVRLKNGQTGQIATSAPALPAAIAPDVTAIVGLNVLARPVAFDSHLTKDIRSARAQTSAPAKQLSQAGGPGTCPAATTTAQQSNAYTPNQVAHAYGFDGLYSKGDTGQGENVDIFELEPFLMSNVSAYDTCIFGTGHTSQINVVPIDQADTAGAGSGEAALDVEEISALAPSAHINVYEAPQDFTSWLDEIAAIVAQDKAPVVSTSWGACEAYFEQNSPGFQQIEDVLFEQAALEGQSWFAASGDSGSTGCYADEPGDTALSVSDPASQPYVTGVGGTTILAPTDPPTEVVWNDGSLGTEGSNGAGGGGISNLWPMPAWQSGLDVAGVSNSYTSGAPCSAPSGVDCREDPDVSAGADELHGDVIFYGNGWGAIGGTSAAAPKWAAVAADSDAACTQAREAPIGFANPALYQIASDPTTYHMAFNDITAGNNDNLALNNGAYLATKGYDMATGLGSPQVTSPSGGPGLASMLCADGSGETNRPVLTGVSPQFGSDNGGTQVEIKGSDLSGVTAVSFGPASVPVTSGDVNVSGTEITVDTPALPASSVLAGLPIGGVLVTVAGTVGSSKPTPLAEFHYVDTTSTSPLPSVSYIGPAAAPVSGGGTVTIIGSGFEEGLAHGAKPTVTFGEIPLAGTDITVISSSELRVVVPPEGPPTGCATWPSVPVNDICQAEVVVTNGNGPSPTDPILPAYSGTTDITAAPPGTELVAAPTEFDYAPTPTTNSISPNQLPELLSFAQEFEPPTVTIGGTGFNWLTLVSVTFGPVGSSYSTYPDGYLSIEPDQVQVVYGGLFVFPPPRISELPVTVQSLGGSSNAQEVSIPPPPSVSTISMHAGPASGGTSVHVTGSGFGAGDQVDFYQASNFGSPYPAESTANVTEQSTTSLSFVTPAAIVGDGYISVCNVSGCSTSFDPSTAWAYFEPVKPTIQALTPTSGPAGGGGSLSITGSGLGSVTSVSFGGALSPLATNPLNFFGIPSDTQIVAEIPPGSVGATVPIKVTTLSGTTTTASIFNYHRSPPAAPADVVTAAHGGAIAVSWKPSIADGGSPLEGYTATATPTAGLAVTVHVGPTATQVLLAPLMPAVQYKISVAAVNAIGSSVTIGKSATPTLGDNGYLVAGRDGAVTGFGALRGAPSGAAGSALPAPIAAMAATPEGLGYWIAGSDGSVYAYGNAHDYGSLAADHLGAPIVGMATLAAGTGYWLASSSGGVFTFGDARFHGSLGAVHLKGRIVAIVATPDGAGYWLVGADGGVFSFGDAKYYGSLGSLHLTEAIVAAMAPPSGEGYWLISSTGGVFSFGKATFHGSLGGHPPSTAIAAAAVTPDGNGYWMLGSDGSVYAFGSASLEGSSRGLVGSEGAAAIGL